MAGARTLMRVVTLAILTIFACGAPLFAASTSAFPPPVVVVYPLTQTSGTSSETGSNIAILLATKLGQLGGITVKPYTPGTERPQYLENALKENADYYVTGFLTPLGAEISLVSQVVSTHSGSVVYSTTTSARTYADAAAQADLLHDAILRHAGRGLAALDAPPPAPSSTPAPDVSSKGLNILGALKRHPRSSPAPSPTGSGSPSPANSSAPKASLAVANSRVLVVEVAGDADRATRTTFGTAFSEALSRHGFTSGVLPVGESEIRAHAKELCAANAGTRALLAAALVLGKDGMGEPRAQVDLTAYDCTAAVTGKQRIVASGNGRAALDSALHRAATSGAEWFAKAGGAAHLPGAS